MIRVARQLGFKLLGPMLVIGVAACSAAPPSVRPNPSVHPSATSSHGPAVSASTEIAACPTSPAAAWDRLCWSTPITLANALFIDDVVTFEGHLFAVGAARSTDGTQEAALWRSDDGATWTLLAQGGATFADAQVGRLYATPSRLVASGSVGEPDCTGQGAAMTCGPLPEMLWTSPDGVTWTRIADVSMFAGATISAVTYGPQGLLAVGDTGWDKPAIWVSDTGAAWKPISLLATTFAHAHFSDVRTTASGYVLAGGIGGQPPLGGGVLPESTAVAAAWWSPDGRTWTQAPVERAGGLGTSLGHISVGAHGFVAVGSESGGKRASAWISNDGRSWRPVALLYAGAPSAAPGQPTLPSMSVCDDGAHLVGLDVNDQLVLRLWISSDGVTWHLLPSYGATEAIPMSPGETEHARYSNVFLVPDGLIVSGYGPQGSPVLIWHVIASQ